MHSTLFFKFTLLLITLGLLFVACSRDDDSNDSNDSSNAISSSDGSCSITPASGISTICYRIGDGNAITYNDTDATGGIKTYYDSSANVTHIKIDNSTNVPKLDIIAQITGTGTFATYHVGRTTSQHITTTGGYYTQSSSYTTDGGNVTITNYATTTGERMQGNFNFKLCKYDINTHVVDCTNHLWQFIGAFDIARTADQ